MHTSFLPFVKKETLHVLRDPRTMTIVLVIPIILMVLFGFAISMEVNNVNVVAVVPVPGTETRTILDRVAHNQYMNFVGTISPDEVDEVLRRGTADAVIVFDRNTPVHINLVMDASRTSTVQSAAMYLRNIISENSGNGGTVGMSLRTLYNPQLKSAYNFVPGIMGMLFLLICCMMTSVSIVREKETGTMEVLLVSPVRPQRIIMAKLVPYFLLSCAVLAIILSIVYGLLGLPLSSTVFNVIWVSLLYILLSLGMGVFVSALTSKQIVALLISGMLFMLPVFMLSGMIFPIENMPEPLQWVSTIIPARWYVDAIRKMMIEQLPLTGVLDDVLILSAMTAVVLTAAVRKFNDKL